MEASLSARAPEVLPEPAKVCKPVKKNLKEKVQCQGCSRWMSFHTLKYQHRCRAQTVAEASAPKPPEEVLAKPPKPKPEKRVVQEKAPPPEKPIKQKSVIKKQARIEQEAHPLECIPPQEYQQQPMDIYQAMLLNRQEQARRHREAMLAPYQQMFSMRR